MFVLKKSLVFVVFVFMVCTMVGCSGSFGGRWTGTVDINNGPSGDATVDVRQNGLTLEGVWSTNFPGSSLDNGGTLAGTILGNQASFTLTPSDTNSCAFAVSGTVDGDSFTGSYSAINCGQTQTGSFNLTRSDAS